APALIPPSQPENRRSTRRRLRAPAGWTPVRLVPDPLRHVRVRRDDTKALQLPPNPGHRSALRLGGGNASAAAVQLSERRERRGGGMQKRAWVLAVVSTFALWLVASAAGALPTGPIVSGNGQLEFSNFEFSSPSG